MSLIKNTAGQYLYAVLVSSADGSAITTGATLTLAKDGAAAAAAGATLTHRTGGLWEAALTQADTNASALGYVWGGTLVIPQGGHIQTVDYPRSAIPAAAANANGGLPVLSVSGTTLGYTLTTLSGHTPQTGDNFVRIGALGAGLTALAQSSTALSNAVWTNAKAAFVDISIASRMATFTYTAPPSVGQIRTEMEGVGTSLYYLANDIADDVIDSIGGIVNIQSRLPAALVSGRMDSSTGAMAAGVIVSGSFAAGCTIPRVTLVDTTTANTDMRGTDGAITSLTGIATATNVSNAQSVLAAAIANVQADTDDIQTRIPATLVGGRMRVNVEAVTTGAILSGSFAAGCTIPRVTLVDTTTANTDMRGTDGAITSLSGIATASGVSSLISASQATVLSAISASSGADAPTVLEIVQGIYGATASTYNASGTMGELFHAAGANGDPFLRTPEDYASGTIGSLIANLRVSTPDGPSVVLPAPDPNGIPQVINPW